MKRNHTRSVLLHRKKVWVVVTYSGATFRPSELHDNKTYKYDYFISFEQTMKALLSRIM